MRRYLPIAVIVAGIPASISAQRGPRAHIATPTVAHRRAAAPVARGVPAPSTHAANVPVVVAFDDAADDSVRAIITRDLTDGDAIAPLAAGTPDSSGARVQVAEHGDSLAVTIVNGRTGVAHEQRAYRLPVVPAPRDSVIADSLARALAERAASRDSTLARLAERADSLRQLLARKPKRSRHFWERSEPNAPDPERATRDSLLRETLRLDTLVRANGRADVAATDSTRRELVAADARLRDSVRAARRWEIHGVADAIQRLVTGEPGIAQSRIAYIADGDIRVVDADGANDHVVLHGRQALSPAWRHDGRALAYSDLTDAGTQIGWVDLVTGAWRLLGATKRGLNITPAFSPDDHLLAFATAIAAGGTGIVVVPAHDDGTFGKVRYVTPLRTIDYTEPVFSPDGTRIAYASARPKRPEIYSARLDGSDERIEAPVTDKTKPYRTSPDWSPDGTTIAFEQQNGRFQVWTIARGSHTPRRLTTSGENEDPTWAPDSRHLAMTTTYAGVRGIWIVDTITGHRRQLTTGDDGRLAAWSPILPTAR
jgi:tol-pal system beta propeller repeat protein TolB